MKMRAHSDFPLKGGHCNNLNNKGDKLSLVDQDEVAEAAAQLEEAENAVQAVVSKRRLKTIAKISL